MPTPKTLLKGVVHGRTIELEQEPGLPDGEKVSVTIEPLPVGAIPPRLPPGEGIRRSAGGWADDAEGLDEYLDWNREQRKQSRPEVEP
jgi:hypothetical protein